MLHKSHTHIGYSCNVFAGLDKDGSGSIEENKLEHICEILKLDTSALIDEMESGSTSIDGRVTLEEFQHWYAIYVHIYISIRTRVYSRIMCFMTLDFLTSSFAG